MVFPLKPPFSCGFPYGFPPLTINLSRDSTAAALRQDGTFESGEIVFAARAKLFDHRS
jgi:hypothetical protein